MDNIGEKQKERLSLSDRIHIRISITQTILAVVGIFIGSLALYAALTEADAVRKQLQASQDQLQASVWPHIQAGESYYGTPGKEKVEYSVQNRGIGPARVEYVQVLLDGAPKNNWFDVVREITGEDDFKIDNSSIQGTVISPDEDIVMLSLSSANASLEAVTRLRDVFREHRIQVDICYCSVFDNCWRVHSGEQAPLDAASCPEQQSGIMY